MKQMDRPVAKQQNRPAQGKSSGILSIASAIGEESARVNLRRRSAASTAGTARPRIAVLSFAASGSERNENLAFALAHEVTTALGRFRCFDVVAGMSMNAAGPACVIREHQFRRMNLDYLVDLTVSENSHAPEINVRLLDLSGNAEAVWSKRFDLSNCALHQIDHLIAMDIVACVGPAVPLIEDDVRPRHRYGAIGFLRRALPLMSTMERQKFRQAGQLIKLALEIDRDDAEITTWAARWQYFNITLGYAPHAPQEFAKAGDLAHQAMKLDPENAEALGLCAHYCAFVEKEFGRALHYFDRSLHINPSLAFIWGLSCPTYCYIGEPRTALQHLDHYRELAPFDPYMSSFDFLYAIAYLFNEDYERAAMVGRGGVAAFPGFVNGYKPLVAALGHLGRREEAKPYVERLLRLEPGFTVEKFGAVYPIKKLADRKRYMEGLRLAGVPAR